MAPLICLRHSNRHAALAKFSVENPIVLAVIHTLAER